MSQWTTGQKTVAAAATPEALIGSATFTQKVLIRARSTNSAACNVGDSSAQVVPIAAGGTLELSAGTDARGSLLKFNLADIYVDVAVDGEGVDFLYFSEG